MKKSYETPKVEVNQFALLDIVTLSGEGTFAPDENDGMFKDIF